MAVTYPYIGTNPQPVVPAGNTPQQKYQTGMSLGMVNPFATSTMMPASPMARTNYLEPTMAAIAARTTQPLQTPTSVAMPTAPLARSGVVQGQQQGVPLPRPRPANMPPSGLDQLRAAQLRMPARGTPESAGLAAAGRQLLAAGGWQDRPVTLGQTLATGLQAYTEAEQAAKDRQAAEAAAALAANIDIANLGIKAAKEAREGGQMFTGTSSFAQSANMLIDLAPKIASGTASDSEKQAYNIAYQKQATPKTISYMNEKGQQTTETLPAMDMSQFPVPEGYTPKETVVGETAKSIEIKQANLKLTNAQGAINRLRNILISGELSRFDQALNMLVPSQSGAQAEVEAQQVRMAIKELEDLGALVGGDFQILDQLLASPNSQSGMRLGSSGMLYQLDNLERQINERLKLANPDKDFSLKGTFSNPTVAKSKSEYDDAPPYSYVKVIDENTGEEDIVFKGAQ